MSEHTTKTYITFGDGVFRYRGACACGWTSATSEDTTFVRRAASQHRRQADAKVQALENQANGKPAKPPKLARPAPDPDKRFLKHLTAPQQARYRELLTGRTNVSGTSPMLIDDRVRKEAADDVLIEFKLGGACCESCLAKAHAKNQPPAQPEPPPTLRQLVLKPWEGRRLSSEELRERMRALRERDLPESDKSGSESKLGGVAIEQKPGKVRFYPEESAPSSFERLEVNSSVL